MFDIILMKNSIVNVQYRATRIAEDVFNTFFSQATDKYLRTGEVFCTQYYFLSRSLGD